jgi:cytochrome c oxidase cbb3-type subunit III
VNARRVGLAAVLLSFVAMPRVGPNGRTTTAIRTMAEITRTGALPAAPDSAGLALMRTLSCGGCHAGVPRPARSAAAPAFGPAAAHYDPAWLFTYLAAPRSPGADPASERMPDFRLDEGERLALALFLGGEPRPVSLWARLHSWLAGGHAGVGGAGAGQAAGSGADHPASAQDEAALRRARSRHPAVDSALGRRIFVALDCAACHRYPGLEAWPSGPPLDGERGRVRAGWLRAYLRDPRPVRPFGFQPGTGSRMPDYHLSGGEVGALVTALEPEGPAPADVVGASGEVARLTPYDEAKIRALLRTRLPCLGCHGLDGVGGRVGPDLSSAGSRLRPDFIRRMLRDPQGAVPGSAMPRVPMSAATESLLVRLLAAQQAPVQPAAPLSLAGTVLRPPAMGDAPASIYLRFCSACHGADGRGDGYNARNLPVPPAVHASAAAMSPLTDDVLYDAISAGGYVMGRSARMPPFGATLDGGQIRGLVAFIRALCRCRGPGWSTDGAPGAARED